MTLIGLMYPYLGMATAFGEIYVWDQPRSLCWQEWTPHLPESQGDMPNLQFILDGGIGGADIDDTSEATHAAIADWGFKEKTEDKEEDCWED